MELLIFIYLCNDSADGVLLKRKVILKRFMIIKGNEFNLKNIYVQTSDA